MSWRLALPSRSRVWHITFMFTLDKVVPWGRSFDEYRRMFELTDEDLSRRILGCADGPANFNAETTRRGGRVVSCDPLYQFDRQQIQARIADVYDQVLEQTWQNRDAFVWDRIRSIEHLGQVRMEAMEGFLADYEDGKRHCRYIVGNSRSCRSRMVRLTWPFARTFCFFTPPTSPNRST